MGTGTLWGAPGCPDAVWSLQVSHHPVPTLPGTGLDVSGGFTPLLSIFLSIFWVWCSLG